MSENDIPHLIDDREAKPESKTHDTLNEVVVCDGCGLLMTNEGSFYHSMHFPGHTRFKRTGKYID